MLVSTPSIISCDFHTIRYVLLPSDSAKDLSCREDGNSVVIRINDRAIQNTILHARFCPPLESFPTTPNAKRKMVVETNVTKLLVVLDSEPPRTPHEIVCCAVTPIIIQVDGGVEYVGAAGYERLSYQQRYGASDLTVIFVCQTDDLNPSLVLGLSHLGLSIYVDDLSKRADGVARKVMEHFPLFVHPKTSVVKCQKFLAKSFL